MPTLTLYLNNNDGQPKKFRARTREALNAKVLAFLLKDKPDVCADFAEPEGDRVPAYLLNFSESTRDWEYRDRADDIDCDAGPIETMAPDYVNAIQSFIRPYQF